MCVDTHAPTCAFCSSRFSPSMCVCVCVCSRKVTLIVRLRSKCLYPLNIFPSPQKSFFTVRKLDQVQLKKTKLFRVNLFIDSLKIITPANTQTNSPTSSLALK